MKVKNDNLQLTINPKQRYSKDFTILPKSYEIARGRINLSSYESRVLSGIESQDFGYPKTRRAVAIEWLVQHTGLNKRNVTKAVSGLLSKRVVQRAGMVKTNGRPAWVFEVSRDFSKWINTEQKRGGIMHSPEPKEMEDSIYLDTKSNEPKRAEDSIYLDGGDSIYLDGKTPVYLDGHKVNEVNKKVSQDASVRDGCLEAPPSPTQDSIEGNGSDRPNELEPIGPPGVEPNNAENLDSHPPIAQPPLPSPENGEPMATVPQQRWLTARARKIGLDVQELAGMPLNQLTKAQASRMIDTIQEIERKRSNPNAVTNA